MAGVCDEPIKAHAFCIRCNFNPSDLLSFDHPIASIVARRRKGLPFAATTISLHFLPPFSRVDFVDKALIPKDLAQMLWTQAYTGRGVIHDGR